MKFSLALIAAPALLLTACNSDPEPEMVKNSVNKANDDRAAEGDVQGGTISDEMLPLESIRSQSPILVPVASDGSPDGASDVPSDGEPDQIVATSSGNEAQTESEPAPEPDQPEAEPPTEEAAE